jgi:urease accessory protein
VLVEFSIMNTTMPMPLLWLLQLADTALPIGALNHSFGLETLTAEESLGSERLELFLHDYLGEVSALELYFCGAAYRLNVGAADRFPVERWLDLNVQISAFRLARESRIASATLGRRFLRLANELAGSPLLASAIAAAQQTETDIHHCAAFGLTGSALGIAEGVTLLAYVHQSLANLISACQRLLPVGQVQATRMLWELKPMLVELVNQAQQDDFEINEAACFAPLVEVGSMRHPSLGTRLFIS